jgi:hypothetical protein
MSCDEEVLALTGIFAGRGAAQPRPVRFGAGFRCSMSYTVIDLRVLEDFTSKGVGSWST